MEEEARRLWGGGCGGGEGGGCGEEGEEEGEEAELLHAAACMCFAVGWQGAEML